MLEDGWRAEITAKNHLVLKRVVALQRTKAVGTKADPIMLEVFNNLFMSIAEQMGVSLQNTAYSVNIKERLDFSCAVFSADGLLVANAPHMPVHLGSMDRAVETIIRENKGKIRPGDFYLINAPYNGGTHIPDLTVCTPVFDQRQDAKCCSGWRAAAITPTSAASRRARCRPSPPRSRRKASTSTTSSWSIAASSAKRRSTTCSPRRNIRRATRCRTSTTSRRRSPPTKRACRNCTRWSRLFGLNVVHAYMKHVQDNADESVRRVIERLHDSEFSYEADQGNVVKVKITVDKKKREATVDFTGTSPQQGTNFNAPEPVTRAAVLYVFRVMVDDDIPMNAGCLRPINIIIPDNSMLRPHYPAAVVAGNVEVSQMVTDTLLGALGAMAGAQGTMNNVNFGNDKYQYYETICSGSPAGPGFPGTDAVHTHMTNTRLTDPEILEFRYPVVLEDFHIRKGSGGKGKWNAGDGIRRTMRFLEKMEYTILSGHRRIRPFGMAGGEDGQIGENWVRRNDGTMERLKGADATVVDAGEAIIIQTPTAGGYGKP